jgi:hypothetical protein
MLRKFDPVKEKTKDDALRDLIEQSGWHKVVVPAQRASGVGTGMDRAEWCQENFGRCALSLDPEAPSGHLFDQSLSWLAVLDRANGDQLFYFKDDREATLFRICRG